jgi:hypothetical protein
MPSALIQEVVEHLEALPPKLQEQVLSLVRSLDSTKSYGVSGEELLQFAGTIPSSELELMNKAIEHDCDHYELREEYDLSQLPILPKGRYAPGRNAGNN